VQEEHATPDSSIGAICEECGQNMLVADTCDVDEIEADDGMVYKRIPYGRETEGYGIPLPERCHDRNVVTGGYHHPGCDMAICPHCGGQEMSCDFDPARRVEDGLAAALARQHRQVPIKHGALEAWVDEGIAPLILACWRLGISTEQSCQDNVGRAYIQFPDGSAAARFVREAQDVRDADLRARILRWPWATPRKAELDRSFEGPEWESAGEGWAQWWEQAWEYETQIRAEHIVGGAQWEEGTTHVHVPVERRPQVAFPVTVRIPLADLETVTRQLQKAARPKGRAR
jgi:hypothetical protein